MKKMIIPIITALAIGIGLGIFMIRQYDNQEQIKMVNINGEKVSFLQVGVYSSEESKNENTKNLNAYVYELKEGKYYIYVAISKNQENINKLKDYFEKNKYNIYVKEFPITNQEFLKVLEQYDTMLSQAEESSYLAICSQVLKQYEELITNDSKNERTTTSG